MTEERLVFIEDGNLCSVFPTALTIELCAEIRRCWAEIAQLNKERTALIKGLALVVAHEIDEETTDSDI